LPDARGVRADITAGTLRAVAVGSAARAPVRSDTPTTAEGGATDVLVATWYGLMAPGKTPPEIVQKLNKAMNEVLSSADAKTYFDQQGMQINGGTPQAFGEFIGVEVGRWVALAKNAGVKLN